MTNFDFTTREEYLAWRAEWKAGYKAISQEIRDAKKSRKRYAWAYRAKGDIRSPKRTRVGNNPDYSNSAEWVVYSLRIVARKMFKTLAEAKVEAGKQRADRLATEAKAA